MRSYKMNSLGSITELEDEDSQMTLRDYFAAKAMQAIIPSSLSDSWIVIAQRSYVIADAMMEAREE